MRTSLTAAASLYSAAPLPNTSDTGDALELQTNMWRSSPLACPLVPAAFFLGAAATAGLGAG